MVETMRKAGVLAVCLLLQLSVSACGAGEHRGRPSAGEPVPAYSAVDLAGDSVPLSSLRGNAVLLNVWATWCPPCREEMPELERLHRTYADSGLRVVAVSIDGQGAEALVREFVEEFGVTFTILRDPDERVSRIFAMTGVPETFLIDRRGRLVKHWLGKFDGREAGAAAALRKALAEAEAEE